MRYHAIKAVDQTILNALTSGEAISLSVPFGAVAALPDEDARQAFVAKAYGFRSWDAAHTALAGHFVSELDEKAPEALLLKLSEHTTRAYGERSAAIMGERIQDLFDTRGVIPLTRRALFDALTAEIDKIDPAPLAPKRAYALWGLSLGLVSITPEPKDRGLTILRMMDISMGEKLPMEKTPIKERWKAKFGENWRWRLLEISGCIGEVLEERAIRQRRAITIEDYAPWMILGEDGKDPPFFELMRIGLRENALSRNSGNFPQWAPGFSLPAFLEGRPQSQKVRDDIGFLFVFSSAHFTKPAA